MRVRRSVSYIKLLITGWTAGAVKQGEGRVVAARRNSRYLVREKVLSVATHGFIGCTEMSVERTWKVSEIVGYPPGHPYLGVILFEPRSF